MMIRDGARIMDLAIRNVQLAGARTPRAATPAASARTPRAATPARPANPDDEKERPPWKPTLG
jgi:hypothetical protein